MGKEKSYKEEIIDWGDWGSKLGKEVCFNSHQNCPAVLVVPHQQGNFRGPVGFLWRKEILKQMADYYQDKESGEIRWLITQDVENDGAGGKPQFFTLFGTPEVFYNLGWEIITMTADDLARTGRFPAIMVNQIDTKGLNEANAPSFQAMMNGYGDALRRARLINITGELAIMKHSITAFCDVDSAEQLILTWGGACIGLNSSDCYVSGKDIRPGLSIIGFNDPGYRCNGGTRLSELIIQTWGKDFRKVMENQQARFFIKNLCMPSMSYARTVTRLVGWQENGNIGDPLAKIYGIAHITGGGLWIKLGELLPEGVGAKLDTMPIPADVLLQAQKLADKTDRPMSDWECYSTFHGGCGMLLIVEEQDEDVIMQEALKDGIHAMKVGKTISSLDKEIIVHSRFAGGKVLSSFSPE